MKIIKSHTSLMLNKCFTFAKLIGSDFIKSALLSSIRTVNNIKRRIIAPPEAIQKIRSGS